MQSIKASDFKARCLALMDEVARTGQPLLITKNGKPVAELRPHAPAKGAPWGIWKDQLRVRGDIISPLESEWDALR